MSTKEPSSLEPKAAQAAGVLPFEAEKYLAYVDDFEMAEAQKVEFLRTLWDIMATFVRMGFDSDSVIPTVFQRASENSTDGLEKTIPTHEFNVASSNGAEEKAE